MISVKAGQVEKIETVDPDSLSDAVQTLNCVCLPGMVNLHSHAFQRDFAGLSEFRTAANDSFWTWRELMYRYVSTMTLDQVYSTAKKLYQEMLSAGYTWVGEFHYLHHVAGQHGLQSAIEMADAIYRAATDTGIGFCFLPVLYQRGGFKNEPLGEGQQQFELVVDDFVQLRQQCQKNWESLDLQVGMALHSLRAVAANVGNQVISEIKAENANVPIHIHIAEQTKEVEACLEVHQARSVAYLLDQFAVDQHWCLIHATHMNEKEIAGVAKSGAVVGLCPTTEANLGDGFFPAQEFFAEGGVIGIGSDSHCSVDMREELRILEYGQRLKTRSRAVLGTETESVGRRLYLAAAKGGGKAIGMNTGTIDVGMRADWTLVDPAHPSIDSAAEDRLLDRLIFVNAGSPIIGVTVGGKTILNQ